MANKSVFASLAGRLLPRATDINAAGAKAYAYRTGNIRSFPNVSPEASQMA